MDRRQFLPTLLAAPLVGRGAPTPEPASAGGAVVLDDCDPKYDGKKAYDDGLSFLGPGGRLTRRVTGLNICQEIGSVHRVAVDRPRKNVWVAETVGGRLLRYDLDGKELTSIVNPDGRPNAVAIDPKTGDAWVAWDTGRAGLGVYDAKGRHKASYRIPGGYDVAFDVKNRAVWLAGKELIKVSLGGKELARRTPAVWHLVTVAADPKTGAVWAGQRSDGHRTGADELMAFDPDGRLVKTKALRSSPLKVAVDPRDSSVWVAVSHQAAVRFSPDLRETAEIRVPALSLDVEPGTGNVWVATPDDVRRFDRAGKELSRTKHETKTSQGWIATY